MSEKRECVQTGILLADGFEEIEALGIIDIFRRVGIPITLWGVGHRWIHSARSIVVRADAILDDTWQAQILDLLILPGGALGTENLKRSSRVREWVGWQHQQRRWLGAICAAPTLLAEMAILQGRVATCYPTLASQLKEQGASYQADSPVVVDGHIITSAGPATTHLFALKMAEALGYGARAQEVKAQMLWA